MRHGQLFVIGVVTPIIIGAFVAEIRYRLHIRKNGKQAWKDRSVFLSDSVAFVAVLYLTLALIGLLRLVWYIE